MSSGVTRGMRNVCWNVWCMCDTFRYPFSSLTPSELNVWINSIVPCAYKALFYSVPMLSKYIVSIAPLNCLYFTFFPVRQRVCAAPNCSLIFFYFCRAILIDVHLLSLLRFSHLPVPTWTTPRLISIYSFISSCTCTLWPVARWQKS
jgi:hypothetical protein